MIYKETFLCNSPHAQANSSRLSGCWNVSRSDAAYVQAQKYFSSKQPGRRILYIKRKRFGVLSLATPNHSKLRKGTDIRPHAELKQEGREDLRLDSGDYANGDILGGKYTIQSVIGRGSNGVTYKATTKDGKEVAVKALSLRRMTGWKQLELFEREAKILESLSHPGIPQYIDYFEEDSQQDRGFFLVQELAQGKSLAELVSGGWRADEDEAKRIALQILTILDYLSSKKPAVVHRDVKPENIVLEGGRTGGRVFLVDFGGVQAAAATESFGLGSTIIGTYGYMAPEQFRGAAQTASDLYALGGTLLYLLSGQPPNAFPQDRMQLKFRDVVDVSPTMNALLEGLLEPVVEDRISAQDALTLLAGGQEAVLSRVDDQPPGAVSRISEKRGELRIAIPPAGLSADKLGLAGFAVTWNVGIGAWTVSAIAAGSIVAAAFSIPFWAAGFSVAREAFRSTLRSEEIKIGPKFWSIGRAGRFSKNKEGPPALEGRTKDLKGAQVITTGYINGVPSTEIKLVEGFNEHRFGSGLSLMEQQWVATKIMAFLEKLPGQPKPSIPIRQKALGEQITEQAHRRVQENLARNGIDWQPDQWRDGREDFRWRPFDRSPSTEYDADISWEEDRQAVAKKAPDSKPQQDRPKKSDANWGKGSDNDLDSATSDDLGLVSAPDDSLISGPDSDERRGRRRR